jgi:hypothetical protein
LKAHPYTRRTSGLEVEIFAGIAVGGYCTTTLRVVLAAGLLEAAVIEIT